MISLYIHIPFCVKKCLYCDFLSFPCNSDELKEKYIESLCNEIELTEVSDLDVGSIFIGGGTPSILKPSYIERILDKIRQKYRLSIATEISLECNPGTASAENLIQLYRMGINRLSIGLQSTIDDELKVLGRIHNYEDFVNTFNWAREAGFANINVDIMSALPGQSLENYKNTVTNVVKMHPEHVSAYSLIVEENTVFNSIYGDDENVANNIDDRILAKLKNLQLPDEDTERKMYYLTDELLSQAGYHRYEISNYALDGFECKHNKVYWTGGDYVSFGIGASSYYKNVRYNNISDINSYISAWSKKKLPDEKDIYTDIMPLSEKDRMEEYMFVGLRLVKGVSIRRFEDIFGISMDEVYGDTLDKLSAQGVIVRENDTLRLTKRGIDVSNAVLCEFLLDN